jgi:putative dimethyl sulfoxide reductase chaperone
MSEAIEETEEQEISLDALIKLNEQRAATYGLLARLFRVEIDEELLKELRSMRFPAKTGNDDIDKGYRLFAKYLSNTWENSITELAVDYSRVFIGHGVDAFSAAYPFESVYTSEKRLLMQDARDEVLAIYRSCGLDKQDSWKEGEDHIALELEFEHVLANRTVEALKKGDEDSAIGLLTTQKNFLEDHLGSWVGMLVVDMKRFAKTDLYMGLAYLVDGFIATDQAFLEDLLADNEEEPENATAEESGEK